MRRVEKGMISTHDIEYIKEKFEIISELPEQAQHEMLRQIRKVQYPKGALLYSGDTQCVGLILVQQGTIRASLVSEEGKEVTLFRIHQDEMCLLSASCIIHSISFDVMIESSEESTVFILPTTLVEEYKVKYPAFTTYIQSTLMERFSEAMWTMEQILFKKLDERVAIYLLDESARLKSDVIVTSQEEIAKNIGSAREAVTRILNRFVGDGIIESQRKSIRIMDRNKLKAIIN